MVAKNIAHFDVHADDVERARKFYERVFEWRFSAWGPPNFFMIATGNESDPGIHGAVHDRPTDGHRCVGFECTIAALMTWMRSPGSSWSKAAVSQCQRW